GRYAADRQCRDWTHRDVGCLGARPDGGLSQELVRRPGRRSPRERRTDHHARPEPSAIRSGNSGNAAASSATDRRPYQARMGHADGRASGRQGRVANSGNRSRTAGPVRSCTRERRSEVASGTRVIDGRRPRAVAVVADRTWPKHYTEPLSGLAGLLARCDFRQSWFVRAAQWHCLHDHLRVCIVGSDGDIPDSRNGSNLPRTASDPKRAIGQRIVRNQSLIGHFTRPWGIDRLDLLTGEARTATGYTSSKVARNIPSKKCKKRLYDS